MVRFIKNGILYDTEIKEGVTKIEEENTKSQDKDEEEEDDKEAVVGSLVGHTCRRCTVCAELMQASKTTKRSSSGDRLEQVRKRLKGNSPIALMHSGLLLAAE